jgi:hypothetical protein
MAVIKQLHNPTHPQYTLWINAVVALGKARRKLKSVEIGISIHAVDEEMKFKTQP